MAKFRIVHVEIPVLSLNGGTVDFVPEICYRNEYHVETEYRYMLFFKRWKLLGIVPNYKSAEVRIKFLQEKEVRSILKEY